VLYYSFALCVFCVLLTTYTVVVCFILYCLLVFYVCYCFIFVIVSCLLWSVKGLHMQISCIATIWSKASNGDIYVLTLHGQHMVL